MAGSLLRSLLLAVLLSAAGSAHASGSEMTGLGAALVGFAMLAVGLPLALITIGVLVFVRWRRGQLRQKALRTVFASIAIVLSMPVIVYLAIAGLLAYDHARRFPPQLPQPMVESAPPMMSAPPPTDEPELARPESDWIESAVVFLQRQLAWWHDPALDEEERRASERN